MPGAAAAHQPVKEIELQVLGMATEDSDDADCVIPDQKTGHIDHSQQCRQKYEEQVKRSRISGSTPTAFLNKTQVLEILRSNFGIALHQKLDPRHTSAGLAHIIKRLEQVGGTDVPLEIWAAISLALESAAAQPAKFSGYCGSGIAPQDNIEKNMRYLQQLSHYSWAQLSHDQLVAYFTREIERHSVDNPAMQDSRSVRVSLEVGTAVKMLSVGGELRYQHLKSVDDEGNYVTTSQVSGGFTCNLSGLFAFLKARVTGSVGTYMYGRSANDHARCLFKQMVADNQHLPQLARYISRAAAAGLVRQGPDEISDFDNLKNAYLLQQDAISRSLSVLLSLNAVRSEPVDDQPSASPAKINLQAVPSLKAKVTQGLATGKSIGAQAGAGVKPLLQLGVKAEASTKTVSSTRDATLCELLQNPFVDPAFTASLQQDIVIASTKIRAALFGFWYGQNTPARVHERTAEHIAFFTQDWQHYRHLHAMHSQGHATTGATLDAFHKKYGVKNTAACLRAMALLVADFYVRLQEGNPGPAREQMKSAVLKLEQDLHGSSIPNARQILEQHVVATQERKYSRSEKIAQFSIGNNSRTDGGNCWVKISSGVTKDYYDSLRDGEYVTVEFTLGDVVEQNRQVLRTISDCLSAGTTGLHADFGVDAYSSQGVYTVKYFRPAALVGLPFCRHYERRVVQTNRQFGADVPLPLAGPVSLHAGVSCAESLTQFISETPDPQTMLYFALHYMHALASGKTDKNGKVVQDSYCYRMEREQGKVLEQLLLNFARHHRTKTGLSLELDAFERTYLRSAAERATCAAARNTLLALAQRLERSGGAEHYRAALAGFRAYLLAYFPYWQRLKENSKAYKKWQYSLN